ncbi:MAG TPA: carboxypeptidase-like regulatory domain-containing protein [Candidatus Ozemobacteraceae bacterium]|nr:carboxypeptidase-like regulatory domain-containing protein [Candidatus Ozemobacteraceae bacterium]
MNVRVWGGWLLAALGITVLMTMGCEKGALGVRSSNLTGLIVDSASSAPIEGVRVRIVSEAAVSTNAQAALGQNFVSVTGANGRFMFTNLTPDKFKIEATKVGYEDLQYPSASSTVTSVYVQNAETVDIGAIKMNAVGSPLPQYISVRLNLRDSKSMELLDGNELVTITFDNQTFTYTVTEWKNGQTAGGQAIQLPAKGGVYAVSISPNPDLYKTTNTTLSGTANILTDIMLEANSYNLIVRCVNVPDYIVGGIMNIYAEQAGTNPPKILATHTISDLGNLTSPQLPNVVKVPGVAFPINLRVNVRGYLDEVIAIDTIAQGEQGNIRIDVDFLANNDTLAPALDAANPVVGILDNRVTRGVTIRVAGPDLINNDTVIGNLWHTNVPVNYVGGGVCDLDYAAVPVGYKQPWTVSIYPDSKGPAAASGSYSINGDAMINPEEDAGNIILLIGAVAKRP